MRKRTSFVAAVAIGITAAVAVPSRAEEPTIAGIKAEVIGAAEVADPRVEPWGTSTASAHVIQAFGFQESDSGTTFTYSGANTHRFRTGGAFPWFDASLNLPNGAQLVGLELEACDTNAAQHVTAYLFRHGSPNGANAQLGSVGTGDPATPGCAFFGGPANLPAGLFVDNGNNFYFVRAELSATDSTTSLGAVRVYYKLRVSAGPAAASFADVPTTNGLFRFVEALAASGITGGCGGGNFCPDAPLTRGQMAVFLATALGLHFPN
jgi:hypothetical protein